MQAIQDLRTLLAQMQPALNPGRYAFVMLPANFSGDGTSVIATMREAEGLSAILPEQVAIDYSLPIAFTAAWITLTVHSDLVVVGLTSAVSNALAQGGISCNVVAGVHHDHLFVPVDQAQQAMDALLALQQSVA